MSQKRFKSGTTYVMGVPDLVKSADRTNPIFMQRVRRVSITGNQLREFGVRAVADLSRIAITPPLALNRTYWCYELEDDGAMRYVGEFTVLGQILQVQAGQQRSLGRYAGIPLEQQPTGLTTLGDAMSDDAEDQPSSYHEYKARLEASQDTISSLQDTIEALRSDHSSDVDRITSAITQGHDQQRQSMQAQIEAAQTRIDQLYKQIDERDRKIFGLQQDIIDLQNRSNYTKMKAEFQRDAERAQRALEKQLEKQNQGGMNDLTTLFNAVGALAPMLLADKTKAQGSQPAQGAQQQMADLSRAKPRPINHTGEPPVDMDGAIRQPVAARNGSHITPPLPAPMRAPRRELLPEEQDPLEVHDTGGGEP